MKVTRRFTTQGEDVFSTVKWEKRSTRITNADGSTVFEMTDAEIPAQWSQLAADIMVSKYFRKAGVPQLNNDGSPKVDGDGNVLTGPERSARQVIHRLAGCWRHWGETHDYFDTAEDAQAFYDELAWMMLHQVAAPNSPQWFNTGLNFAYDISGPAQGHWTVDAATGEAGLADDAYTHPQPHACFIQAVSDDLVNEGGIMDLWTREARLFKYGSGTGTNFSSIRGENEPLSGGGKSSGLMSFLKIGDRAAGAIKSGGTTRRAAKMVCLDADHPDIEEFVSWKVREELKVAALAEGLKHLSADQQDIARELDLELNYDFNGEAYQTVSGQNSNNSVRLSNDFFNAVDNDEQWHLTSRTNPGEVTKTVQARSLWDRICFAAWRCADPGLQFDTTINEWHTCPNSGRINASNPCSEYMFLDNTACNLASINLLKFYNSTARTIDLERFEHAVSVWTMVLEISVLMAAFPSREIAEMSYRYRTLGLGFANLGAMLMQGGIPYDSEEGRAVCGAITSILCGRSYATSARMAAEHGAFPGYMDNRDHMLRVIRNHRRAAHGVARESGAYEDITIAPVPIDHALFRNDAIPFANADELIRRATGAWDDALEVGERHGFRNAQVTVIAPTGTIGLLMDCDTTGVEPDFALVKFKKLAGGGYFKIANASLRPALTALGYSDTETDDIVRYVMGSLSVDVDMPVDSDFETFRDFLESRGYTSEDIVALEDSLPTYFELGMAFNAWSMPERVLESLGVDDLEAARSDMAFNGLKLLGLSAKDIEELNVAICGTQTIEGAPLLRDEHLAVFDCANRCGNIGERFIAPTGHIRMMAAAQPFISGAISKTINLPAEATVEEVASSYWLSWELGLKANALYRDGSKLSQPLSTRTDADVADDDAEDDLDVAAALEEVTEDVAVAASAVSDEPQYVERIVERIIERPMRRRLPDTRRSVTHRFNVAGHEGYLTVGLYEDGAPGELFITMSKEGSTIGGLMDSLGTAISVALQYGVPLESLVKKFAHQRFEPCGMTTNRDVPFAKSLVDYIFRWLGMEFIAGYREANAPKRSTDDASSTSSNETTSAAAGTTPARDADRRKENTAWESSSTSTPTASGSGSSPARIAPSGNGAASTQHTGTARIVEASGSTRSNPNAAPSASSQPAGSATMTATELTTIRASMTIDETVIVSDSLSQATAAMQSDAPACDVCGSITVRNGTCYKCFNCGNSMGCS